MTLTQRDLDLVETLTLKVPVLTIPQIADVWWRNARSQRVPRHRLARLAKSGWIAVHVVNAHRPPPMLSPLFAWKPGAADPDVDRISRECRAACCEPAQPTEVCVPTPRAAGLLGSNACGLPPREIRDHDLRLAAVYVHYRRTWPRLAHLWLGRHARPRAGFRLKDPDALLCDGSGRPLRLIQAAGRWNAARVERFHDYCTELALPYEIW
jgi:hypothetical protein